MKNKKPKPSVKSSTQDFTEIAGVQDDILIFKSAAACVIIAVGAANFVLLSREEQIAMINSYASLLNSLSFPIQILILSKKMDIFSYLEYLDGKIQSQPDSADNQRLGEYREFIQSVVKKNTILEKKFYFIIPFSPLEMGIAAVNKKSFSQENIIARAKIALYPKREHLLRLLKQAGLTGKSLYEEEITNLFYNLYNPSATSRRPS